MIFNSKIEEGNLVKRRLEERQSVDDILDELYVRCLTRRPNEKETDAPSRVGLYLGQEIDQEGPFREKPSRIRVTDIRTSLPGRVRSYAGKSFGHGV